MKRRTTILITDDNELNRSILIDMLENDFDIIEACNGKEAVEVMQKQNADIDLMLLDLIMPEMDGFEVLAAMSRNNWIEDTPVIMISSETGSNFMERAYELGASDFISRPFVPGIVRRRIVNTIALYAKQKKMMELVTEQTLQKEKDNDMMVSILSQIVEFRNGESRRHVLQVNALTKLFLTCLLEKTGRYHLRRSDISTIRMASSLHDIGKITIPENILNKPGRLSPEEFEIMKGHSAAGAEIIEKQTQFHDEPLILFARQICRWHHERWDGKGYPDGLKDDDIPIAAQVVSLADVFDALTSKRCYKEAYTQEQAIQMIMSGECGAFNPELLEILQESYQSGALQNALMPQMPWGTVSNATLLSVSEAAEFKGISISHRLVQLQTEQNKRQTIMRLSEEIWLDYTTQSSVITLSVKAQEQWNLPAVIFHPEKDDRIQALLGQEGWDIIQNVLQKITPEEPCVDVELPISFQGEKTYWRLSFMFFWENDDTEKTAGFLCRMSDITQSWQVLDQVGKNISDGLMPEERNLLATFGASDCPSLTEEETGRLVLLLQTMNEEVRLVDAETCMNLSVTEDKATIQRSEFCFSRWNRNVRCEQCVSRIVTRTKKPITKLEVVEGELFSVRGLCIEMNKKLYAIVLTNRLERDNMFTGLGEESILQRLSLTNRKMYLDSTTGAFNRRYYDEKLRDQSGLYCVAMLDMDDFKQVNDTFGHDAGDIALHETAKAIQENVRRLDDVVRYGGDEFCIVFQDMRPEILPDKLEAIRKSIEEISIPDYPKLHFTVSIGAVHGEGVISQLIRMADVALYQAKKWKNKVCISQPVDSKSESEEKL